MAWNVEKYLAANREVVEAALYGLPLCDCGRCAECVGQWIDLPGDLPRPGEDEFLLFAIEQFGAVVGGERRAR